METEFLRSGMQSGFSLRFKYYHYCYSHIVIDTIGYLESMAQKFLDETFSSIHLFI